MSVALVIGASRGIGREFVRQLLADGWQVFATARDDAAIAELNEAGAAALKVDVTRPESIASLGWHLDGVDLDLALYVAGVYGPRRGPEAPPTAMEFDQVMHANLLGAMHAVSLIGPLVEAAHGCFAFLSSGMGSIQNTQFSEGFVYRTSKAALNMLVRCAAFDYRDATMVALSPGWVQTDMGGEGATLTVGDSVASMLTTLEQLTIADSGRFIQYDGVRLPW